MLYRKLPAAVSQRAIQAVGEAWKTLLPLSAVSSASLDLCGGLVMALPAVIRQVVAKDGNSYKTHAGYDIK